jgi:hypothetical protein
MYEVSQSNLQEPGNHNNLPEKEKVIGNNRIKVAWLKLNDFALRQVQYNEELILDVYNEA